MRRPRNASSTALQRARAAYTIGNVDTLPGIERTVSQIGEKVARARSERGWSLAQLAQRAGVSPGAVHKIEKSGMTPTIASLMKVAAALGKSVSYFVDEPEMSDVIVVRADERARVYTSKQGLELRNLAGRYGGFAMAGAEATVEPGADSGPVPMNHPGEELVIVLEGQMAFEVDGEVHEVHAGDSIHFRAVRPHAWRNPADEPARAVWLVVRST
jgi:quercetin dioxygenase-like cupin family protein/DNA-binding XRE family transcriptional regulator